MKDSRSVTSRLSSAALLLLWLSSAEQACAFSAVGSSLTAKKAVHSFARSGFNYAAPLHKAETRLAFEPLPNPGVPSHKPETKIVEKEVYDEPEKDATEVTPEQKPEASRNENGDKEIDVNEPQADLEDHKPIIVDDPINTPSAVNEGLGNFLQTLKESHAALIMAAILMAAMFLNPLPAMAAVSGGRMGGSYPTQRSSPAPRLAPGGSYSSGYSRGFTSGYYSRPSVYVNPFPAFPTISPFWSPSYYYSRPGIVVGTRGPGLLEFLVFGAVAFAVANAVGSFGRGVSTTTGSFFDDKRGTVSSALGPGVSVAKISVALEVPQRDDPNSILSALDRISRTARTDSRVGIQNLTSQVALELLRRKSSIVSASTKYNHFNDRERAQREFNNIAIKERAKFERETVSQYGGVDYTQKSSSSSSGSSPSQATMAVVTLIIAIEGDSTKLPNIRSAQDVESALSRIASDSKVDNCLQSCEILWTPEERTETLTNRDVVADYPDLRSI